MKNDLFEHFFICFIVTEALNLPRNTVIVSLSLLVANILLVVLIEDLDTLLRNFILMGGFLKLGQLDLDWVWFLMRVLIVSDFLKPSDTRNKNYGLIFFKSANRPIQLYLLYMEVFLKVSSTDPFSCFIFW